MHVQRRFRCHGIFRCLLLTRTPSSTYDDLCALLEKIKLKPDGTCPDPLPQFKIPCRCPLPGGSWDIPPVDINIPKPASIPSWLTNVSCACLLSVSRSLSLSLSLSHSFSLSPFFVLFWLSGRIALCGASTTTRSPYARRVTTRLTSSSPRPRAPRCSALTLSCRSSRTRQLCPRCVPARPWAERSVSLLALNSALSCLAPSDCTSH
jgi:hypothetical protein